MKARHFAFVLCLSAGVAAPAVASAQPSPEDRAIAETLFQQARKLMDEGRHAEACPKLEESQRVAPAGGTLLNLAACHETIGRIAAAWAEFREAESQAKKAGRADREKVARTRATALEPLVPKLVVQVPPEVAALGPQITRDGAPLGAAAWGVEIPLDPGPHTVRATAPGYVAWEVKIEMAASKRERLVVPALQPEPAPEPAVAAPPTLPTPPPVVPPPPAAPPPQPPARPAPTSTRRVIGWSLVGVGVASVGAGAFYGVKALSKRSDSNDACTGKLCSPEGYARNEEARSAARSSNLFLGMGVVVSGGGLVLALTAPSREGSVSLALTRSGVDVRGRF